MIPLIWFAHPGLHCMVKGMLNYLHHWNSCICVSIDIAEPLGKNLTFIFPTEKCQHSSHNINNEKIAAVTSTSRLKVSNDCSIMQISEIEASSNVTISTFGLIYELSPAIKVEENGKNTRKSSSQNSLILTNLNYFLDCPWIIRVSKLGFKRKLIQKDSWTCRNKKMSRRDRRIKLLDWRCGSQAILPVSPWHSPL